ncbi:preprotein translocase subunit SecE [Thermodesulfobacterium hydrogeniphilum]|uniref:preprotein translocase subunit SecE n=1 Tax=Thermodesulfobacterium hydrogeniphilum TaxID=161156 RepID=UPI00068A02A3|nr:preprotein translocase subunit SecE [Thermodesulfobacterium hydrogeniphilum]
MAKKVTTKNPNKAAVKNINIKEGNLVNKAVKFLKDVKIEAKKITWPERKQVLMSALMVLAFSLFIGGYLGLLDVIYNFIISFLVR